MRHVKVLDSRRPADAAGDGIVVDPEIAARVERFRQIWVRSRKRNGWLGEPGYLRPAETADGA